MLPLFEYWSVYPTTNMLLIGFFGVTPKGTKEQPVSLEAADLQFASELPFRTLDNCPPEIQSWLQELKEKQGVN